MAQPIQVVYNLAASLTTAIVNAQAAGATTMTLATTIVDPNNQRRLLFTTTADDSPTRFVIVGTNQAGFPITETIAGVNNSTTQTNMDFKTVASIKTLTGSTVGTVSFGTNGVGSTLWYIMNQNATPVNIECSGIVSSVSTAVTWGVQYTYDDPNNLPSGVGTAAPFNHPTLNNLAGTTSLDGPINDPVFAIRFIVTAGTGTVRGTIIQAGAASP